MQDCLFSQPEHWDAIQHSTPKLNTYWHHIFSSASQMHTCTWDRCRERYQHRAPPHKISMGKCAFLLRDVSLMIPWKTPVTTNATSKEELFQHALHAPEHTIPGIQLSDGWQCPVPHSAASTNLHLRWIMQTCLTLPPSCQCTNSNLTNPSLSHRISRLVYQHLPCTTVSDIEVCQQLNCTYIQKGKKVPRWATAVPHQLHSTHYYISRYAIRRDSLYYVEMYSTVTSVLS